MRIAQLATNVECVPPVGYGGTELIVHYLTEGFSRGGHDVTLFATGDSHTTAHLVSVTSKALRTNEQYRTTQWQAFDIQMMMKVREMASEFDVIHNHMGYQALPYLADLDCAVVTTLHNGIKTYCAPIFKAYSKLPYVSISNAYRRFNYGDLLNYVATIYNGIDVDAFMPQELGRKYLLFLGRVCRDKGTKEAIEIAEKLNLPLKIAGKVDALDQEYFDTLVRPRLKPSLIEYIGEVGPEEKLALYAGALAVVYPINFEEPFGLVMAEALATNTPLMAFDRGSVRELLIDGENAIIGNTVDELVQRYPELQKFDRTKCREQALKFSNQAMIENYLGVYEKLMQPSKTR